MQSKRQKEILDIAVKLLADGGSAGLSIKTIASAVGVSEPAIYRHFGSKHDILCGVIDSFNVIASGLLHELESADLPAMNKLGMFMQDRLKRVNAHPKMAKVMFSEELFQGSAELSERL